MIKGPIVIVEDDVDDQELYEMILREMGIQNELRVFGSGKPALEYLLTTEEQPFIILSDINMPEMSGLDLKSKIQEDPFLVTKGIPFVFLSTNASAVSVRHAHALSVQGYFQKPDNIAALKDLFHKLFGYWQLSRHINSTFD